MTSGDVRFVHDGGEAAPSYDVTVGDGSLASGPAAAAITFTNVNDAPTLGNNSLTIAEGGTVVLSGANLSASDVDDAAGSLVFTVSNVSGGQFERVGTGVAITSFSQADVTSGDVRFVHDGGEGAPAYSVTVSDAQPLSDGPGAAAITFSNVNDAPTVVGALGGQVTTDKTTRDPFTGVVITDADLPGDSLTVDVSLDDGAKGTLTGAFTPLGGGVYRFTGSAAAATAAIQGLTFDPTENRVAVGAAETTTFTISVSDGTAPAVTDANTSVDATSMNDAPTAMNVSFNLSEDAGVGTVVGVAAVNEADPGDALTYAITGGNGLGAFTIDPGTGVITVADPSVLDFETNPVFNLTVQVQDGSLATDTATTTVNLTDQPEIPVPIDPPDPDPVVEPPTTEIPDPVETDPEPVGEPTTVPATQDVSVAAAPPSGLPLQEESRRPSQTDADEGRGIRRRGAAPDEAAQVAPVGAAADDSPFVVDAAMWRALDLMGADLGSSVEAERAYARLLGSTLELGTAGMAAGFLTWFLRGGSLLTSLLSTLPLWSRLDPLPVLSNAAPFPTTPPLEEEEDEREAGRILDESARSSSEADTPA